MSATATTVEPKLSTANAADTLAKSFLLLGTLMVTQRLIGFARSFFVCRVLSPGEVGQLDLSLGFLALAAPFVVLGIPGSFGRYIVPFQMRGQQSAFLKRSAGLCAFLCLLGSGLVFLGRTQISRLVYGDARSAELIALLALGLPALIFFNFASCWFSGLRLNRIVVRLQFTHSVFFAALTVLFLQAASPSAKDVIVAYLLACLLAVLLALNYLADAGANRSDDVIKSADTQLWSKILPFAAWIWVSNLLINLFAICDRLIIVNWSVVSTAEAQMLVGQYHSSHILPLLLVAVGGMVGSMITPYLSHDWESRRYDQVADKLNLMLKASAIGGYCVSVMVLLLAPYLFSHLWQDKFASGEKLLPLTLTYCSWAAMTLVAQKYFWCLEKTWLSSSALFVGLSVNVVLGLLLLPGFGLPGVVFATLVSHLCVLATVLLLCHSFGMRLDGGVLWLSGFPAVLCFGVAPAMIGLVVMLAFTLLSNQIFSSRDKTTLHNAVVLQCCKIRDRLFGH